MKFSTKHQFKGMFHVVKGTIRSTTGMVIPRVNMKVSGRIETILGRAEVRIGRFGRFLGV